MSKKYFDLPQHEDPHYPKKAAKAYPTRRSNKTWVALTIIGVLLLVGISAHYSTTGDDNHVDDKGKILS